MNELIWLTAAIVLFTLEAVSFQLVSIWFAIGAVITMIAAICGVTDIVWQLTIFLISSLIFLIFTRSFVKKFLLNKTEKTNVDGLIGKEALVTEPIDNIKALGAAKISGNTWTARSADGSRIPEGTIVTVAEIQGVKLIVSPTDKVNDN